MVLNTATKEGTMRFHSEQVKVPAWLYLQHRTHWPSTLVQLLLFIARRSPGTDSDHHWSCRRRLLCRHFLPRCTSWLKRGAAVWLPLSALARFVEPIAWSLAFLSRRLRPTGGKETRCISFSASYQLRTTKNSCSLQRWFWTKGPSSYTEPLQLKEKDSINM